MEVLAKMLTTTKTISSKLFKPSFEIDFWLKHFRGFNNLGAVKYELGQIDEAERSLAKALELNAKNINANFNAGLVALAKGDDAKAEEYFGNAGGVGSALDCARETNRRRPCWLPRRARPHDLRPHGPARS